MTIPELFSLRGKACLITGATGYLGSAMAAALAEAGANVIASSRNLADAQRVAAGLPVVADEQRHHGVAIDHMADEAAVERAFAAAVEVAGGIDVLVNNGHELIATDWTTTTAEAFTRQLANASGYFVLARLVYRNAVERKRGASIILLGSMYGLVGSYPDAYEGVVAASPVAYHALKGSVLQMTRHLAVYWAKQGVRVNAISPGPFPPSRINPEMAQRLVAKVPMGRLGQPDELKGAVVFLASEASSYMTGQNMVIDGGWTAW